jgi:FkbM family methyltransferase
MTMVSYAQNGEDVVLARAFPTEYVGFYVDVGASDPVVDSVTKHFYDRGWNGVNVEPAALPFEALQHERVRDISLNVGLAAALGEATFYELPEELTGCSTFLPELADEYGSQGWEPTPRPVEILTLAAVCADHVGERTIDFLKIDVEGHEAEVLEGADFERFRPRILVVESTAPGTTRLTQDEWEPGVLEARYRPVLFDGLNRFYVREEDADLSGSLEVPANVLDDYISNRCHRWREEARELSTAEHESRAALTEAIAAVQQAQEQGASANTALVRTREQLAHSQAVLRDTQAELAATRQALITALPKQSVPGAAA